MLPSSASTCAVDSGDPEGDPKAFSLSGSPPPLAWAVGPIRLGERKALFLRMEIQLLANRRRSNLVSSAPALLGSPFVWFGGLDLTVSQTLESSVSRGERKGGVGIQHQQAALLMCGRRWRRLREPHLPVFSPLQNPLARVRMCRLTCFKLLGYGKGDRICIMARTRFCYIRYAVGDIVLPGYEGAVHAASCSAQKPRGQKLNAVSRRQPARSRGPQPYGLQETGAACSHGGLGETLLPAEPRSEAAALADALTAAFR